MDKLELNQELLGKVLSFCSSRGYSHRTFTLDKNELNAIFLKHKYLDKHIVKRILDRTDNSYKRAVIKLISNSCSYYDIDCPDFKIIAKIKKPRKIPITLSEEEIKIMIASVPNEDHKLFLRCIYNIGAGLRVSEIIKLKWEEINWVSWLNNKGTGLALIQNTKRDKSFKLPIPNSLMEDLYKKAKDEMRLNEFRIPTGFLIFSFTNDIYKWNEDLRIINKELWIDKYVSHTYSYIRYNILQKYCEKALGKKLRLHSLRHSKATFLLDNDFPIEEISELLGHSDIRTSMIYAKVNPKKIIKRFENINGI